MGDNAWLVMIALVGLVNPIVIAVGLGLGLVARQWWQVLFSLFAVPLAYLAYSEAFAVTDDYWPLLPLLAPSGLVWAAAAFGLRRAATSP
jgi:hypothetical protein